MSSEPALKRQRSNGKTAGAGRVFAQNKKKPESDFPVADTTLDEEGDSADDSLQPGLQAYATFCGLLKSIQGKTARKNSTHPAGSLQQPKRQKAKALANSHQQAIATDGHQETLQVS